MKLRALSVASIIPLLFGPAAAAAAPQEAASVAVNSGDTAWIMVCSALVLLMTIPGLALFYGGLVHTKNVLATLMQSFIIAALISVQWVVIGYSLAFSPGALIGGLDWIGLQGVGLEPGIYSDTIPHQAFTVFQLMFAIITPALMTGAFAERMKFSTFLVFTLLWATFIYDPLAHWVWGSGGWLGELGALDFAGGTVVHISSGVSALVAALMIGRRINYGHMTPPHNLPFTVLGASLLWVGWFGFNAGSSLAADGLAVSAFVVTNTAGASGVLGWMGAEWFTKGKPTMLGAATGAVAGLVAITPAAGFVGPVSAIAIGFIAGKLCYWACELKARLGYDDALDVVGVHGVGGVWGALATGVFASTAVNPDGANGLLYGNPGLVWTQFIAVVATVAFAGIGTFLILSLLKVVMGLRVTAEEEQLGLDMSQHSENAYAFEPTGYGESAPEWALEETGEDVPAEGSVLEGN